MVHRYLPTLTQLSSDSDTSPLRDIDPSKAANRSSLSYVESVTPNDSASNSGSDEENGWNANKSDAMQIKTAIKRVSAVAPSGANAINRHRRRSPTNASSGSPPNDSAMFTASHARRMVKSEKRARLQGQHIEPTYSACGQACGLKKDHYGERADQKMRL